VNIFDRTGALVREFALDGSPKNSPLQVEWDRDGSNLAVLCESHSVIALYNVRARAHTPLETNLRDPSFMAWSKAGPQLAVGTGKGNLLLYNSETRKSQLIAGKHSKRIACGTWNRENKLALASLDRFLSINDDKGDLVEQTKLKYDPFDIQFAEQKVDTNERGQAVSAAASSSQGPSAAAVGKEHTVSINMGHQTILMYNMTDRDNPVELAFQPKYGDIATYRWYGDGYMMVGFAKGYIIGQRSAHAARIRTHIHSSQKLGCRTFSSLRHLDCEK